MCKHSMAKRKPLPLRVSDDRKVEVGEDVNLYSALIGKEATEP